MPSRNINYENVVIYKIVCNDLNITDVYIGNTTDFTRRKQRHKNICSNENDKHHQLKVYQTIRNNGGWDNWNMIEIEKYPCNDGNSARARERYWYDELKAKLNTQVPNRTSKEYYDETYESQKDKKKQYRKLNDDKIKQYRKEHAEEKIEYNKLYRQANIETLREKRKIHNKINADKIKEKQRVQVECKVCHITMNSCCMSNHKRTLKHQSALNI